MAIWSENPNLFVTPIFLQSWSQSSLAVVAESAASVWTSLLINVMGNIIGFLDLVAWSSRQLGGWVRVPFLNVRVNRFSQ